MRSVAPVAERVVLGLGEIAAGERRKDHVHVVAHLRVRGLKGARHLVLELALRIDGEYARFGYADGLVGSDVRGLVAVAGVVGIVGKERLDVLEAVDLEDLGLLLDDLLAEGGEERRGRDEQRSLGQREAALVDAAQEVARQLGLADGARRQVDELVLVALDGGEVVGDARLRPVEAEHGQHVAPHVRLGDRAVDVRYDHLVRVGPQEDVGDDACRALQGRGHRVLDLVGSGPQVELGYEVRRETCGASTRLFFLCRRGAVVRVGLAAIRRGRRVDREAMVHVVVMMVMVVMVAVVVVT